MKTFIMRALQIFTMVGAAFVAVIFLLVVWQAGHAGDVRRAHAEGRTCGDWFC